MRLKSSASVPNSSCVRTVLRWLSSPDASRAAAGWLRPHAGVAGLGIEGLVLARTAGTPEQNAGQAAFAHLDTLDLTGNYLAPLGLAWDDVTGKNNGQYAPFSWKSA